VSYTVPSPEYIAQLKAASPSYMNPISCPHAVVYEGALTDKECDDILKNSLYLQPYEYHGCNAITREVSRPLADCYKPLLEIGEQANTEYWSFDITDTAAWIQTYIKGCDYLLHVDGEIGQQRKLTAVALISKEDSYAGGALELVVHPNVHEVPRTRGTVCVFPSWIYHRVTTVERGSRCSVNLGFWGPQFK